MHLLVNGQSRIPPGFRFHPTEEELLHYYLRKKVAYETIDLDVIQEVNLNKLEPWDIQEVCKIGSNPQNDWYFFSHKDKKYPTGTRTNRATAAGYWKATGRDKVIYSSLERIGMRKTLVFYKGRAPHGQKSVWIMHEYRLDESITTDTNSNVSILTGETTQEDGWVVCRVFKKKNHHKTLDNPNNSSSIEMLNSSNDGGLDQIVQYMRRTCKLENQTTNNDIDITISTAIAANNDYNNTRLHNSIVTPVGNGPHETFQYLPTLESPTLTSPEPGISDWASMDLLVAFHLNGEVETSKQPGCITDPDLSFFSTPAHDLQLPQQESTLNMPYQTSHAYEIDLWSFNRSSSSSSSSDPLCYMSNSCV